MDRPFASDDETIQHLAEERTSYTNGCDMYMAHQSSSHSSSTCWASMTLYPYPIGFIVSQVSLLSSRTVQFSVVQFSVDKSDS